MYVYPRVLTTQEEQEVNNISNEFLNEYRSDKNVIVCEDAPVMKVSSSFIRDAIKNGKDVRYLLTEPVYKYIDEMNFYK